VVKAINLATQPQQATLKLQGVEHVNPAAECIVLTSDRLTDNNSLSSPHAVTPRQSHATIAAPEFSHEFPPRSLTVLRIETESK
jgi:alpha-L-arabinofuranosidase